MKDRTHTSRSEVVSEAFLRGGSVGLKRLEPELYAVEEGVLVFEGATARH